MRKKLIFMVVSLAFLMKINAQVSIHRVKFGVQASPTFSWVNTNNNDIKSNGSNLGFKLGVTTDYFFAENYALTTGLGFAFNQGGKLIHKDGGNFLTKSTLTNSALNSGKKPLSDGVNIRYHVQYLEVPIGLKLRTQQFGYIRAFAEAPVFTLGFKTKATGDIIDDSYTDSPYLKENIKEDVHGLAFSWGFGAGIYYDITPTTAAVAGLYFQKGVFDMTKKGVTEKTTATPGTYTEIAEDSKASIGTITLRIGIIF